MNEQVLVYEVKSSANENADKLFSDDRKYFYWNDTAFKNLNIGDFVFVVNTHSNLVLFSKLDKTNITVTVTGEKTFFSDSNKDFEVSGKWNKFIRLEIIGEYETPEDWKWKSLGSSETTYLNGERINTEKAANRILNINQLKELTNDTLSLEVLDASLENFTTLELKQEIIDAIESDLIQKDIEEKDFYFQKALSKFSEFESLQETTPGFFKQIYDSFINSNKTYKEFIKELPVDSPEHKLILLIGQLVSYCDINAAAKKQLNDYEDKRTLARSFVRQTDWVKSLLNFKANNNDFNLLPPSIKNALLYLKDPSSEVTMLSENHRMMVSKYLLKHSSYNKLTFVSTLLEYFKPYDIVPKNPINLTRIISNILYRFPNVKKLWFEKVEGLAVLDSTKWQEDAIDDLSGSKYIVFWWHRSPSKRAKVDKLLQETISDKGFFYVYYCERNEAVYRAKVIDFSYAQEYTSKNWNKNNDVAWFHPDFASYADDTGKSATILFLVDEFIHLATPIPFDKFEFFESEPPNRINLQPYSEVESDDENDSLNISNQRLNMPNKEIIQHAHTYITDRGFQYQYEEIANFYLALCAKPFVILAGISGTGKTQLPRKFAASLGFSKDQVLQLPVRPDWTDGSDLLGYTSLDGNFIPKDLTIAIRKAAATPDKPFFFILDEMNLARVEHYFSDFLSVIETRERVSGEIKTDPILREEVINSAKNKDDFSAIGWPQNLYLIGTVNMDETTHSFSRKVLDRANSIEMNEVDLNWINTNSAPVESLSNITNALFLTSYLTASELPDSERNSISSEMELLQQVNKILQKADLHFAYRVRDEIAFYLILNKKHDLIDSRLAFDFQLVQKILPRIHGSSERVQTVLVEILNLIEGKDFRSSNFEFSMLDGKIEIDNLKYRRASKKIIFMLKRFDDDRFTSFWL